MGDLIRREDALDAIQKRADEIDSVYSAFWEGLKIAQDIVEKVPSAEPEDFEWCHDCKEYDQDKHCCHRWTKVIRNTIEEIKTKYWRWIPVTKALPENRNVVLVTVYWHETYQVMMASYYGDGLWWCVPYNNCGKHMQKLYPIAWMPLPEVFRGE